MNKQVLKLNLEKRKGEKEMKHEEVKKEILEWYCQDTMPLGLEVCSMCQSAEITAMKGE